MLAALPLQAAEIYRWKDAQGVTHYSDSRPAAQAVDVIAVDASDPVAGADAPAPVPPRVPAAARVAAPDILMYTNPACGWCRKADRYFAARGLSYRSIDITASAANRESFRRDGGRGTPLIFIDGQRVSGYNEARLDALIAQAR